MANRYKLNSWRSFLVLAVGPSTPHSYRVAIIVYIQFFSLIWSWTSFLILMPFRLCLCYDFLANLQEFWMSILIDDNIMRRAHHSPPFQFLCLSQLWCYAVCWQTFAQPAAWKSVLSSACASASHWTERNGMNRFQLKRITSAGARPMQIKWRCICKQMPYHHSISNTKLKINKNNEWLFGLNWMDYFNWLLDE